MISFKKWTCNEKMQSQNSLADYGFSSLTAKVAASRFNKNDLDNILKGEDYLCSPFDLIDMSLAAEKINEAVYDGRKILVYGDYDADGVCATAILYSYLEAMGAEVGYYIPSRETEGYGLNLDAIDSLISEGYEFLITVDNGIAAVDEIDYAISKGMDVVVTDHHMPQENIPNCICVNPHREDCPSKFKDICGAFVAFKLVCALEGGEYENVLDEYSELVAIATIADSMPLTSENRSIVKYGLKRLAQTDRIGLSTLIDMCYSGENELDSVSVSFGIIPRINAAGRMGDANRALKLILSEDENEAELLCEEICRENDKRKDIEQKILEDIDVIVKNDPQILDNRVIVISSKEWHHGVLGIVATRIVDKYGKPAIILSEEDSLAIGSGRSVEGFDLFSSIIPSNELLVRFGGHSLAVGLTVEACNVKKLYRRINEYAEQNYPFMPEKSVCYDALITPDEVNLASVKELSILSPFGKDNEEPVFRLNNLQVNSLSSLSGGKHTRLSLSKDNFNFSALYFGCPPEALSVYHGKNVDIIVRLKTNAYQGTESVSIQIVDIRPSGIDDKLFFREKQLYEIANRGEELTQKQANYLMPSIEEARNIYKILRSMPNYDKGIDALWWQLSGINRAKLEVIIKALSEVGLIEYNAEQIKLVENAEKTDLFSSNILKHISLYVKER